MFSVDWTISVGNIITVAGFLGGGILFMIAVRRDVDQIAVRLEPLENAISKLTDILIEMARQSERMNAFERELQRNNSRQQRREPRSG